MTEPAETGPDQGSRQPLSRGRILERALELVDAEGLEALSMRRLAAALDVSPMSLYNHVADKDALLEGIVEQLLGEIDLSALEAEDWAEGLKQGLLSFRQTLLNHPNVVSLLATKQVATTESYRPIEAALTILRHAGFSIEDATKAHWTLVGYTLGHVAFILGSPMLGTEEERRLYAIERERQLPADEFPCMHDAFPFILECDTDEAYEFGIDTILEGLRARLHA